MIKLKLEKCILALNALGELKERQTGKGDFLKAVVIPSAKAKTGYWLGRIEDKLSSIDKEYKKSNEKLIKELGEEVKTKSPDPKDATKTIEVGSGQFRVLPENFQKYKDVMEDMMALEEEIDLQPFDFEMFEGIDFPQSFWTAIVPFLKEPK